jgi:hypothetical protein
MPRPELVPMRDKPDLAWLRGEGIFTPEQLDKIVAEHLGSMSEQLTVRAKKEIQRIAGTLRTMRAYRKRPTGGQKKRALEKVAKPLKEAAEAVRRLDRFTRAEIGSGVLPYLDRLGNVARRVEGIAGRIKSDAPMGRIAYEAERSAIGALRKIWTDTASGTTVRLKEPPRASLIAFALAALGPVFRRYPPAPDLAGLIDDLLAKAKISRKAAILATSLNGNKTGS